MLVRVSPGQVRFVLPGLIADARGGVGGGELLFRFGTLDRLVTFLRLLTRDGGAEDVAGDLRVGFVRSGQGPREVLLRLPHIAGFGIDAALAASRAAQGLAYTGSGRHFVVMRDTQSPLGYDVVALSSAAGDLVLYGHSGEEVLQRDGESSLKRLLLRLELRRDPAPPEGLARHQLPSLCFVSARRGLGPTLIEYFHRAGIRAEVAACATADAQTETGFLFRLTQPPARLLRMFSTTPGLALYLPATENVIVAWGFSHPVHLDSCRSVFAGDRLVILSAPPRMARVIESGPRFSSVNDLVKLPQVMIPPPTDPVPERAFAPATRLKIQLRPGADQRLAPSAVLVPWGRAAWLRRLCFALPESVLTHHLAAALPQGLLLVSSDTLAAMPLGTLFASVARGVLVPVGCALRPAVSSEFLEQVLNTADGSLVIFPGLDQAPVRVPPEMLQPLERRLLARLDGVAAEIAGIDLESAAPALPAIEFASRWRMPLWGRG